MKKFDSYEKLMEHIGAEFKSDKKYCLNELNNFLETVGSDPDPKPICSFNLEIDGNNYSIGVTYKEEDENIVYTYWIL